MTQNSKNTFYFLRDNHDVRLTANEIAQNLNISIAAVTGSNGISAASSYEVQVRVYDKANAPAANTTESNTLPISTQSFPIDVKKGGKGVAVGKVAEKEGGFEIGGSINAIYLGGIKILWYS